MASFLLGKAPVDSELDSLFKTAKPQADDTKTGGPSKKANKKRRKDDEAEAVEQSSAKRSKKSDAAASAAAAAASTSKSPSKAKSKSKSNTATAAASTSKKAAPKAKGKKDAPAAVAEDVDSEDEDVDKTEAQYLASRQKDEKAKSKATTEAADGDNAAEGSDEDDAIPVHESLQKGGKKGARSAKQKVKPADETPEQRDRRTVFVGNLPMSVASQRPLQKQLQRHIIALVPTAKIESVRFRSVPFQAPTAKMADDAEGTDGKPIPKPTVRQHDKERTSAWRAAGGDKDEVEVAKDTKTYLTPSQKKRVAFINQEFHASADSVNAYIVFGFPVDQSSRPANLPPLPVTMDPYEAAALAVEKCNNTTFLERLIRVDRVGKAVTGSQQAEGALLDADPKLTLFVGSLDFESKEEDLRVFFETLLTAEKGAPEGEEEVVVAGDKVIKRPKTWVTHVRIIRDKDTQLGKGFAYVQFVDKDCVDEILAMDSTRVKFAKRKLRVERCKSVPGTSLKIKSTPAPTKGAAAPARLPRPAPVEVPKGDPALGERLAHLSKEDRKDAKSKDADRVARRLAKKKARMAMGPPGAAAKDGAKDRERVRKPVAKGPGANPGRKAKAPRVRSANAAKKRNFKKD